MALFEGMLRAWQRSICKHRWVRARWEDGSYGLRCAHCMQAYPKTWEDVIGRSGEAAPPPGPPPAPLAELHRPA